jgi:hypothetical protein
MSYCIAKELLAPQGRALSNRYKVKRFKSSDLMHKFLNGQYDNQWKEIKADLKSGTYFQQIDRDGARWINVKALSI